MKQRAFRAFRSPVATPASLGANFNRLWGAQALSQVAQNLLNFALIIRVFQLAQGTRFANISVALLILSFGVPSIFFAAAAGVYVDHWNKKVVMVIANFLRAILVLGYIFVEHDLVLVLVLSFLISSITQFFAPAETSSIPALVKPERLLRANSLFVFTLYASFIVGYSASAPVIAIVGPHGPYITASLFFLIAGLLVTFLPSIHVKESRGMPFARIVRYTGHEILHNWELIRHNHNLSFPILQLTITQACLGVLLALAPALAIAVLHTPIQDTSQYLIIPAGAGMVAGVIAITPLVKYYSKARVIAIGLVIASVALILLGLSSLLTSHLRHLAFGTVTEVGLTVACLVLILGFMNAVVSAASQTILQENTTDATRGKVFGALNMMVNIAATAPIFFAATIADLTSVNTVITSVGVILFAFAVGQYGWLRRHQKLA